MSELEPTGWPVPEGEEASEMLRLTAIQLNKDAGDDWVPLPLPEDIDAAVSGMERMVRLAVLDLLERNPNQLATLFYRFDLSEIKVNRAFSAGEPEVIADQFTVLILRRSLQKVLFRKHYRS